MAQQERQEDGERDRHSVTEGLKDIGTGRQREGEKIQTQQYKETKIQSEGELQRQSGRVTKTETERWRDKETDIVSQRGRKTE